MWVGGWDSGFILLFEIERGIVMCEMPIYIRERSIECSKFIIKTGATIKDTARKFGVSESTVQRDVSSRIKVIDTRLYDKVRKIIEINKSEAYIIGGLSTKKKYETIKLERELKGV